VFYDDIATYTRLSLVRNPRYSQTEKLRTVS